MITTTLKALLQHKPCVHGYNKLACRVTGNDYDADCRKYVPYQYDKPISLLTILESNGLYDALWALRACEQTPQFIQAVRLYAVWCVRQVQHHMTDKRSIAALDVAERHANGLSTDAELETARTDAVVAATDASKDADLADSKVTAMSAAKDAVWVTVWNVAWDAVWGAARAAACSAAWDTTKTTTTSNAMAIASSVQKQMFIQVFCGESINIDPLKKK